MHKKAILVTCLGTLLEWAEFTFFAYMASQLAELFFPTDEQDIARFKAYAIFSISYLVRPLGALLLGALGDKYGRKPAMLASLILMSSATLGIGLLPTYQTIGNLAPILLIALRIIQGIAIASELNGAAILILEQTRKVNHFLAGSFSPCAAATGMVFGSFAATVTAADWAPSWAWRIPFLLSAIMAFIALYLRTHMQETHPFLQALKRNQLFSQPILAAWKHHRLGMLYTAAFALFMSVYIYIGNIYYKSMIIHAGYLSQNSASKIISYSMLLVAILIPIFGIIADKLGGEKVCSIGLFCALLGSPLMMSCAPSDSINLIIAGQIFFAITNAMVSATCFTLMLRNFQTGTRYSGSSVAWSISTAIFGGTALMISEFLVIHLGWLQGPGYYLSLCALLSIIIITIATYNDSIITYKL